MRASGKNMSPEAVKMRRLEKRLSILTYEKFLLEQDCREVYELMKKLNPDLGADID